MKASQGSLELVLIVLFMIGCVPLLVTLAILCSSTRMHYLDDKTMYRLVDSVDYEIVDVNGNKVTTPTSLAPIKLDYGGAQLIAIVNDDYCPDMTKYDGTHQNMKIIYSYDASSIYDNIAGNPTLTIEGGWSAKYFERWSALFTNLQDNKGGASRVEHPMFLVWNSTEHCWMITDAAVHPYVNIFEER